MTELAEFAELVEFAETGGARYADLAEFAGLLVAFVGAIDGVDWLLFEC